MDGSDERSELCAFIICPAGKFKCNYGGCVDKEQICDKDSNCLDNSDEGEICVSQLCPLTTFRCQSGRCIDDKAVCDNFNDCLDK